MNQPGPCVVCGLTNYPLSMGGPQICPSCDCGIPPTDSRHPKAQLDQALCGMVKLELAEPPKAIRFNPGYVGTGRIIPRDMQTETEAITEELAKWMLDHGLSTGHGSNPGELLKELHWQFEQPRLDRLLLIDALKVIKDIAQLQSGVRWQTVQDACERTLESVTRPHPNWTPSLTKRPGPKPGEDSPSTPV